jgi:hypothetical protein
MNFEFEDKQNDEILIWLEGLPLGGNFKTKA